MRRILEKRVLPVLAAVCLLVTMVAVAMSFASADNGDRLNNWQGYITTELLINGSDRSNADADGNYLKLSETELYVGDSIRTNGQWMNYDLNYTNGGDSATGKVSGMQNWYCDGEWMFNSQLYYGKINGSSNNDAVKFTKAGTWTCTSSMSAGGTVTLITFEVAELDEEPSIASSSSEPSSDASSDSSDASSDSSDASSDTSSDSIDFGSENPAVDYSPRTIIMTPKGGSLDTNKPTTASPSSVVSFNTDTVTIDGVEYAAFFVGDSLINNGQYWTDVNFTTADSTSTKIYNAYLKCDSAGVNQYMQVGYGHTMGSSNDAFVFEKPGEYRLVTGDLGGEKVIARFYVFWPTQDIIDQLVDISQNGGSYYYEKQRVNLVVNDTTGTMCDYVGVDVLDIHVSDSLYIDTVWSNYLFEYRLNGISYQGTVDKVYLYGVEGAVSGYKQYVPSNMGETDHYTEVVTGFGEYIDVNNPDKVNTKLFTFELTGTYAIYGEVVTASGMRQNIYMGSFVVSKTPTESAPNPKFTNSEGVYDDINDHIYAYQSREIKYYTSNLSSTLGQYVTFDGSCNNIFYVSDTLLNGSGYWSNQSFNYTDVYGQVHTGKIYNLKYVLVTENGTKEMGWGQVGYGHTNQYGDYGFELTEPGLWMLIGQQIEDDTNGRINNIVMATFTVFALEEDDPRGTGDQFTDVSDVLKWSGTFNKADFRGDRNNINANGYLYADDEELVSLETIAPLRLGTKFNVSATYAKNIEVGGTDDDQFVLTAGDLMLQVKNGDLGTYEANLIYRGEVLGTTYFTEDYKSAVGNYTIENNLGKITVYKDNKALSFTSAATGSKVSSFDISGDYYFNVAYVSIGVAGNGSYIPYLMIKPIDPTVVNVTKTIKFAKFDEENWKGSTGNINSEGRLVANGRDLPSLTSAVPYNLGDAFEVSSSLMRTNGYSNYYGEKYVLKAGDLELRVGNDTYGENLFVAQVYYQGVLLGTADRGTAGGYSISATWTLRFENGNISVVANESKDGTTNTIKFVSEATGSEVTSFQVDEWDFERTYVSVTAAGNYGPDGSCYVDSVTIAPKIGAISGVGSTAGTSGSSTKTGDTSAPIYIIFAVLVAAGAVLVTVRKVRLA